MLASCSRCGGDALEGAKFCSYCGTALTESALDRGSGSLLQPTRQERVLTTNTSLTKPSGESVGMDMGDLSGYIGPVTSRLLESHKDQPVAVYAISMGDYKVGAVIPQVTCEAVGGRASDALNLAYAYSLGLIAGRLIDDIMDRTIERRGKRTVWREFGDPVAIPTGLRLISEMFESLSTNDITLGRTASDKIARTFRLALVDSARSEEQEKLSRRSNALLTFSDRVRLAQGKRGTLIAAGTAAGAIAGGGTDEEVELLKDYGLFMGTANQLFDDSRDPDYPQSYRERALSECRDLTAEAMKCTDRLRQTEAQRKLRDLCKITEVPLL